METLKRTIEQRGFPGVVAIDFDAVISDYRGWQGKPTFPEPIDGCKAELEELAARGYRIVVFTTRGDLDAVAEYMDQQELPYYSVNKNVDGVPEDVNDQKILADVYIDDRAINFGGRWKGIADRVDNFQVHWRSPGGRPFIGLQLVGYPCDQLSFYVTNIEETIQSYQLLTAVGMVNWVRDTVTAYDRVSGKEFNVHLAFNYTLMPIEFELLSPVADKPNLPPHLEAMFRNQQQLRMTQGLSHLGFHVDDMQEAVGRMLGIGYRLLADVVTKHHTGCKHVYRYTFFDTADTLGFYAKFIERIA